MSGQEPRRRRLIVEFELPDMFVDDLPELLAEIDPETDSSEAILEGIGSVSYGALTVEIAGEKDSEIVTVPVLARTARVENGPPSDIDHLREHIALLVERAARKYAKAPR